MKKDKEVKEGISVYFVDSYLAYFSIYGEVLGLYRKYKSFPAQRRF